MTRLPALRIALRSLHRERMRYAFHHNLWRFGVDTFATRQDHAHYEEVNSAILVIDELIENEGRESCHLEPLPPVGADLRVSPDDPHTRS